MSKLKPNVKNAIILGTLCSVSYLAVYIARNILGTVSPQMIEKGIFSTKQVGTLSSVYFISYAIGQLINGYIGDKINTVAIDASCWVAPKSCQEFTDRIIKMLPIVLYANGIDAEISDKETLIDLGKVDNRSRDGRYLWCTPERIKRELAYFKPYSYFAAHTVYAKIYVTYEQEPRIIPNGEVKATVLIENQFWNPLNLYFDVRCPEGFSAEYKRTAYVSHGTKDRETDTCCWDITIKAESGILPMNKIFVEISSPGRLNSAIIPIIVLG